MKKIYFLSLIALTLVFSANCAKAQSTTYTKQIIIVNGGNFSNADDYVTVSAYNPETQITNEFATIYTQSVQSIVLHENFAYVAAQDSIVKLNIDSYEKVSAVAAPGINQLATDGNVLVASFWYPVTENFVKIFSLNDLSLITNIEEVSGEAAGILIHDGVALVAVPGGWGSTTGKIASIDLELGILLSEDDYGEFYAGIGYFAFYDNVTTAFMKTPWGGTDSKAAKFDLEGEIIEELTYEAASLANNTGQVGGTFYAEINNGIGEFDLASGELTNTSVVAPQEQTIAASVLDTNNMLIYLTTTDFASTGAGFIFNTNGESVGSFEAGISAQAIAVDYRDNTSISERNTLLSLNVFPNPTTDFIKFNLPQEDEIISLKITDVSGRTVLSGKNTHQVDVSMLNSGLYFISAKTEQSLFSGRFIKK